MDSASANIVNKKELFLKQGDDKLRRELLLRRIKNTAVANRAERDAGCIYVMPRADERSNTYPLSYAQQRLWFIAQMSEQASAAYHVPGALRLKGRLDEAALRRALDAVVARHEALRTRFVMRQGQPMQEVVAKQAFALSEQDLGGATEAEILLNAQIEASQAFDLAGGPLIRGRLLKLGEQDHVLLVTMHHIISDGWSMGVLVKEFSTLYEAFKTGRADPLPALPIQYADYAVWQRQWLQGARLQEQVDYL